MSVERAPSSSSNPLADRPFKSVPLPTLALVLVDPDPARRTRLSSLLEEGGHEVVASVEDADALDELGSLPDAVVVGLDDLHEQGASVIRAARTRSSEVCIVAVTPGLSGRSIRDAFAVGVDALVLDSDARRTLAVALRAAYAGQVSVPSEWREQFGRPSLSARQKQVLAMVVMGFTNAKIASTLGVAESTVKSHLFAAFKKLGVRSRKEASALILDPETGLGSGILTIPGAGSEP